MFYEIINSVNFYFYHVLKMPIETRMSCLISFLFMNFKILLISYFYCFFLLEIDEDIRGSVSQPLAFQLDEIKKETE